jgi:DNA-binding PadR family transcriptional regulator
MIRSRGNAAIVTLSAIEEEILTVLLEQERYGIEILKCLNTGRKHRLTVRSVYLVLRKDFSHGAWAMKRTELSALLVSITKCLIWGLPV